MSSYLIDQSSLVDVPTEYLSTDAVQEQGELRRAAVERFLEAKFSVLLKSVHKA